MGKRKPLKVGDLTFATQEKAKAWFKDFLARCQDNAKIDGIDHVRMMALLRRHPEAEQKIGCGVDYFYAAKGEFGTRCFYLVRTDKSKTDFSYLTCITAKAKTPLDDFKDAARYEVQKTLMDWKRAWFLRQPSDEVSCPETGVPMTFETADVDHRPPWLFDKICSAFLEENNLTPDYSWISHPADNQLRATITDEDIRNRFRDFHDKHADLQVIDRTQNLRHGHKRVRTFGDG